MSGQPSDQSGPRLIQSLEISPRTARIQALEADNAALKFDNLSLKEQFAVVKLAQETVEKKLQQHLDSLNAPSGSNSHGNYNLANEAQQSSKVSQVSTILQKNSFKGNSKSQKLALWMLNAEQLMTVAGLDPAHWGVALLQGLDTTPQQACY